MTAFVRNQWYVAAYGREVGRELLARTVLGEPLVLYRTESGEAIALADRCVHRRYPLSESRLSGDTIVCGYHGFTYDTAGSCVFVPGQQRIPRTARVPSYPVVEQDSFVWVWIGDRERADATPIPRAPWLADPRYTTVSGMEPLAARYGLLVDNLLDLSHETYLHGGYIGTPEVANTPITTEVDEAAGVIYVSRHMADAECPPFYATSTGIQGRITRWQDIEYQPPCLYLLHSRIAPVGVLPNADGTDPDAFHLEVVYAITPETEHSTLDFWAVARDFALDDAEVSTFLHDNNRTVVLQDVTALNILEQVIATEPAGYQELSVNIDTGGLAARRMLKNLAAAEPTTNPTPPRTAVRSTAAPSPAASAATATPPPTASAVTAAPSQMTRAATVTPPPVGGATPPAPVGSTATQRPAVSAAPAAPLAPAGSTATLPPAGSAVAATPPSAGSAATATPSPATGAVTAAPPLAAAGSTATQQAATSAASAAPLTAPASSTATPPPVGSAATATPPHAIGAVTAAPPAPVGSAAKPQPTASAETATTPAVGGLTAAPSPAASPATAAPPAAAVGSAAAAQPIEPVRSATR